MTGSVPAADALDRLRSGNRRFVSGTGTRDLGQEHQRRRELASGQAPFAIILGCSDSRVPAELIFDQGLGDLFVIRVAGNIVAPSLTGSVEYAATQFGVRLAVVLGHSQCGAVRVSLEERERPSEHRSPNLQFIVNSILPGLESIGREPGEEPHELLHRAVRENIRASVRELRRSSRILRRHIRNDGLQVVGAEYSLETGVVEFFDGLTGE